MRNVSTLFPSFFNTKNKAMTVKTSLMVFVFLMTMHGALFSQINVTGTAVTSPALAASYTTLDGPTGAIAALNAITSYSTPGTIIFTINAGYSETMPIKGLGIGSATLNPLLSAINTVTIIKAAGTVTLNAGVGTSASPSATPDGMLYLNGADHVTIDGLTFTDSNSASATVAMEYGIAFFKRAAGDGSNNNTIRNCTFNMQRISNGGGTTPMFDGSWAIEVLNSTPTAATTSLTPTNGGTLSTNGTNSGNKFYSNTINGGNGGIGFGGFAASSGVGSLPNSLTFLGDLGNDVGGSSVSQGNTILNYGGGAATNPAAGIRANNQWSLNISYNTINNNNGSGVNHATTLRGIYAQAGTTANVTIKFNTVSIKGGGTTSTITAIENGIGGSASFNTVDISNNTIQDCAYSTATSGALTCISNSASASNVIINNNTIQNFTYAATTGIFTAIVNSGTTGTILFIEGNTIQNITLNSSGTHPFIVVGSPGGTALVEANTIQTITCTATTGTMRAITASTPVGLYTVNLNTIDGLSYSTLTSTGSITGIYNLASATLQNVNNNIIRNFSTPTTGTLNGIQNNTTAGTFQCRNNQIYGFTTTAGGVGGFSANGITWSNANVDISGNIIYSINSTGTTGGTGGTINGITHSGAATISRNTIYDLSSNSTNAVVNGINVSATGTNTVSNNLIGDLRAPNSTGNIAISGIVVGGGTTNNIFHNTVNIAATTTSATTFGTSAIYFSSATPINNLRNNIFVNTSTPGPTGGFTAAIRYTSAPTSTIFPAANNNNFYYAGIAAANRVIYCEGATATPTNGQQTIANYKTYINTTLPVAGRESASASGVPNFVSTTGSNPITNFLKYDVTIATQIEQGGILGTGITTDYSGTTVRCPGAGCPGVAATPDVGAWELNGIALDLLAPAISYTTLGNTLCATAPALSSVTITDGSGVNITAGTRPRMYFRKGTNTNVWNDNTSGTDGWKYVEATGVGGSPFSFTPDFSLLNGGVPVGGDIIHYFVVAQDNAGTPNVGINTGTFAAAPTSVALTGAAFPIGSTPSSYTINSGGLSGTVNVGPGETYLTLTAAGGLFATLNAGGLTGNLTANITGNITTEDGVNALNALIYDCAGPYTLTIKPTGTFTVSGTNSGGLIRLNGADYVTIDGSSGSTANTVCPPSAASRDLTITNTNISPTSAVVWLQTAGADGATNNKVINCNLIGSSNTQTLFGVGSGSSTINTSSLGTGNHNNSFVNNNISKTQYGIYSQGASAANKNTGTIINQNLINTVSPNNVAKGGIMTGFENGITISGNSISGISVSGDAFGISLGTSSFSTSSLTGNEVTNAVIDKNNIGTIIGSGTNSAAGIILVTAASGTNLISNNMIYGVTSNGTSGDFAAGIIIGGGAGSTNIFYNTVSMVGDRGSTSSSLYPSYALAIGGSNPSVNVNNNILYNTQTSTGSTSTNLKSYAIALGYGAPFTALVSDRNDLYTSGAVSGFGLYGSLVPTSGTSVANLIAWQGTPGKDANSLSVAPVFTSSTDLHLVDSNPANIPLNSSAITVSVTDDIDCGTRDGSTPDIGAHEFTPPVCAGAIAGTASALPTGPFCGSGSSMISASGYSFGTGSTYQWQSSVDGGFTTPVNIGSPSNSYANLNTGTITDTTFFRLKVTCTSGTAEDFTASPVQIVINPSVASISGLSLKCPTDPAITLTENGGTGTSWLWSTTETTSSITVNPVSTTTYTVTVTSPGACITSATKIITVNPLPTITAVGVTPNPVCAGSALNLTSSASPGVLGYSTGSTTFAPIASGSGNVTLATAGSASTALTSGNLDDGYWNALALPFSFTYFGTPYATINVQTNGIVSFTAFSTSTGYNSSPQMPNTAAPNNILGVFGDQDWTLGGVISTYTSGVAPNRIFVINYNGSTGGGWYNLGSLPTALVNYQIQLFENGNKIQIHSTSIPTFSSLVRTMGIENSGGTAGLVISGRNNSTWTITNDAVEFTPTFVNYSWTGPNTFTSSLQNPTIASAGPSGGIYTVQVTDNNGCTASSSTINVTVNALPTATISYAGNPYCKTGMTMVTQTGQGGGSYASAGGLSINTGTGEVDLGASTSGAYTVTYSFTDGTCPNTTTAPVQIEGTVVKSTADAGLNTLRSVYGCITEGGTITYDQLTTTTTVLTADMPINKNVTIQGLSDVARPEITLPAGGISTSSGKTLTLQNVDLKSSGSATFTGTGYVIILMDAITVIKQ